MGSVFASFFLGEGIKYVGVEPISIYLLLYLGFLLIFLLIYFHYSPVLIV